MCLIAFALNARPGLGLLLAANRDEYFDRPTARLHRWNLPDGSEVVAGRDLREGGTWLGAAVSGRVAMLTNVRSAELSVARRSRGDLVTQWLGTGLPDRARFVQTIDPQDYGGFNLVIGDLKEGNWSFVSNRNPASPHDAQKPDLWHRPLPPGLYALSNASLDTDWPKTSLLRSALAKALESADGPDDTWQPGLQAALGSRTPVDMRALPRTGVPLDFEQALASPFVHMPERAYGTRSSLIMSARVDGSLWHLAMDEWHHGPPASPTTFPAWNGSSHRRERVQLAL
jgi:uncharacterized protein with NRDE domain